MTPNNLSEYLATDHKRLNGLLKQAIRDGTRVDLKTYEQFRKGLLRHISIEEKIAFPALRHDQGETPDPVMAQLRLDHGAFAMLLVPTPSPSILATLVSILALHNATEEKENGVYEQLDMLAGKDAKALLDRFQSAPEVPVLPTKPLPEVIEAVRRAVRRAGRDFIETEGLG